MAFQSSKPIYLISSFSPTNVQVNESPRWKNWIWYWNPFFLPAITSIHQNLKIQSSKSSSSISVGPLEESTFWMANYRHLVNLNCFNIYRENPIIGIYNSDFTIISIELSYSKLTNHEPKMESKWERYECLNFWIGYQQLSCFKIILGTSNQINC